MCPWFDVLLVVISPELTAADISTRLLAVLLLIGLNAFFVTAEFSIVSVRRSRVSQLVSQGDAQAKTVQRLQRSLDRLLSTTQLGITLASLALGWIGESTLAVILSFWIARLPLPPTVIQGMSHSLSIPLAFFLIAYLQIVLGELCPKSVAILYPEQLARFLGPPSLTIARLFNPFIWILNQSTRWLLGLVGIKYSNQFGYSRLTPEELQLIISTSAESPGLEADERELLNNVFEFRDVTAGEIMIPRTQIDSVPQEASLQEVLALIAEAGHSRYPAIGESLDDIRGIIDLRDLLQLLARDQLDLNSPIQTSIRPARFVAEYMPLHELLHTMQRTGQEMVMVVDEFGGTAGLVTLRDVTSEIVGDVYEADDEAEVLVKMLDYQSFLVKAQTNIETVNELLRVNLPFAEEYQTLGGFLIYQMQKIPTEGDCLIYEGFEWVVLSVDGPRLQDIRARRLEGPDAAAALEEPALSTASEQPLLFPEPFRDA
ncbi:MAG: HlyC/CorC family transporter [Cyanobacteria bacterium Co-bin8]|nr:HlyC/CorC family transporter [Cyanobacteria bacterium Co-bin8]